jgi:hypothetical protein
MFIDNKLYECIIKISIVKGATINKGTQMKGELWKRKLGIISSSFFKRCFKEIESV